MINANSFRFFLAAAIWATLASGCTVAPASGAPSDAREVTVRFGDLDLSNLQGATATALYRRIRWAAEQVCSPFDGRDIASKIRMETCVHRAVADAVTTVNRPTFFAADDTHDRTPLAIAPATAHRMRRLEGL
jgi:UrcA family protein